MQTRLEPPIEQWPTPTAERPIWTGHQLTLFHPGIVAKYLAAEAASVQATPEGVPFRNIVVDQDVYDPFKVTLPRRDPGHPGRLLMQTYALGRVQPEIPVGMQPPAACEQMARHLEQWPVDSAIDTAALREAFWETDSQPSLAAQMDKAMRRLLPSLGKASPSAFASTLLDDEAELVDQLLRDALRCAKLYNDAVKQFPGAGMSAMSIEPDRIEVPMWALRWMKPRQRVYVDIADSSPMFITDDGEPLAPTPGSAPGSEFVTLAPRALLMTALLRRPDRSSLFIHGTGGWNYDRITEQWWQAWQKQSLAPMALATADVYLDFDDVPHGPPEMLRQAIWKAHHLPHNLDRELGLDGTASREKRELLAHMDNDRDKKRRRAAFDRIHQINRELVEQHPERVADTRQAVEDARLGVANAAIAGKRDWSFLLYPPEKLETLRERITYAV